MPQQGGGLGLGDERIIWGGWVEVAAKRRIVHPHQLKDPGRENGDGKKKSKSALLKRGAFSHDLKIHQEKGKRGRS